MAIEPHDKPDQPPGHKPRPVLGRFNHLTKHTATGDSQLAQQVPPNTELTGPLLFADQFGNPAGGPMGNLSSSIPLATLSLSTDGQYFNFTSPDSGDVTLLWSDPSGAVPNFTGDFTEAPVLRVTGGFGTAVLGTTTDTPPTGAARPSKPSNALPPAPAPKA
jgi:hypothetical protein